MVDKTPTVERDSDALFVKNGVPVKFCFHKSVTQGRSKITRDVERHGGQIVARERLANVLLIDEQEDLAFFRRRYYSSTELYRLSLYIEPRGFVQACIRAGDYCHVAPAKQGMPGRVAGAARRQRVEFTEEDRDRLAYYIATRCPTRDGRMGNKAYKDLEQLGQTEDRNWAWVRRHTFHSWREHYKMNSEMMDLRIDYYLQRLKDIGHHLGQDMRRHDHLQLREEEEEEDNEKEEEVQRPERQDRRRRQRASLVVTAKKRSGQAARNHLKRHEQDVVTVDEEESDAIQEDDDDNEIVISGPQRIKRHRGHSDARRRRGVQGMQEKRARVSKASTSEKQTSGVEAGRDEESPVREEGVDMENSQEFEGSDLFGDRAYKDESRFDFGEIDFPRPLSPRASPVPEQDGPPLSTQATLIASPRSPDKEHAPASALTPTKVVAATLEPTVPPSLPQALVMTQEHALARDALVQLQPTTSGGTRARGGAPAVDAPYRNTRARSHSIDSQHQLKSESQLPRQRKDRGGSGKGKAKEMALSSLEEEIDVEEGKEKADAEEDAGPVSVTIQETVMLEDEMAVEGMLEASVESKEGGSEGEHDEDGNSDVDSDGDSDGGISQLPRFQEIVIGDEPSDSDDAETHASLVRGAIRERSADGGNGSEGGESNSDHDSDESSDSDDADRIKRMADGMLCPAPAPAPRVRPKRSKAPTQTQTQTQRISPRRTRSGNQARAAPLPTAFPSPGTKARMVVDRFQQEERRMPYAPPVGTRAAKAAKGRGTRGQGGPASS